MNIGNNEMGLGGALANDTCTAKANGCIVRDYPIVYNGQGFPVAETAFILLSSKVPPGDHQKALMTKILQAKLFQHKHLIMALTERGGAMFILDCSHVVSGDNWWEGVGIDSPFVRCLYYAYNWTYDHFQSLMKK